MSKEGLEGATQKGVGAAKEGFGKVKDAIHKASKSPPHSRVGP